VRRPPPSRRSESPAPEPFADRVHEAPPEPERKVISAALTPRAPGEWQGMLIDANASPACAGPADCSLGRGCIAGKCVACKPPGTVFARGEECVLDHCGLDSNVLCRRRDDCQDGDLCILSGYSDDRRGNSEMRALCASDLAAENAQRPPSRPSGERSSDRPIHTRILGDLARAALAEARYNVADAGR